MYNKIASRKLDLISKVRLIKVTERKSRGGRAIPKMQTRMNGPKGTRLQNIEELN